jgi:hypothetical protein
MKWRLWASLACFMLLALITYAESQSAFPEQETLAVQKASSGCIQASLLARTQPVPPLVSHVASLSLSTTMPLPQVIAETTSDQATEEGCDPSFQGSGAQISLR